ncbi:hypothetical protein DM01DRAFT_1319021 [Hesseltinella vesiculosa]|uniref:Uncharacterized protein n=1 Tax=Hesseltinella vesiculosa TaxID=101127 RepID=A0A1X2GP61_9FUNG|nr:hypothetical protein DM01DRAFT_1319021 [Hesseltinella vesiculosa]
MNMKAGLTFSTLLALLFVQWTQALPIFEIPNTVDLSGKTCPLLPAYNQACPSLCVTNYNLCPPSLSPTCPVGQQYCLDGTCATSCEGITNICNCGDPTLPTNYVPCAAGQQVNITYFNPRDPNQISNSCAAAINVSSSSAYPVYSSPFVWVTCPVVNPYFTWREPMWIFVWSYSCFQAAVLLLWHLYKTTREHKFHREIAATPAGVNKADKAALDPSSEKIDLAEKKPADASVSDASSMTSSLKDFERLRIRGFKNDIFGYFSLGTVILTTVLFIVFLSCIVSDNYGTLTSVQTGLFLTGDLRSQIYCVVWHISGTWFAVLLITQQRLVNYFRVESYVHQCPHIQIERKQDPQIFLDDGAKWLALFRRWEAILVQRFGWDILVTTTKIRKTTNNVRFFEYQCMRYIFNAQNNRFEPYEFDLGSTNRQLRAWSNGISSEDAHQRLELLGPNLIHVKVPGIPRAILQEFSSLLYLYQMMCMWVWYYFIYFKMGIVQTVIIVFSAFIRVFLRLRGEYHIRDMAEQHTLVNIYRDGEWIENVASSDLVPGDVFELREDEPVPCDAVLLNGEVVVNESALTGEAMPVRKVAIPLDDNSYDTTTCKTNTLFAGTIISQVNVIQPSEEKIPDRAYALALRTGIATEKGTLIHKILFPSPVSFIFNEHIKVAIGILLIWGLIAFALSIYLMGRGNITSWYYGIFVLSEIFSPLLPAAFTINQSVCAARLRSKKILCIDLPRINLSGKVRIFCFDKTGTLTKEGLEFFGAKQAQSSERQEDPLLMDPLMAMGIATCHAVTQVKGQFVGNPVDIESFRAMQWTLSPPAQPDYLDTLVPPPVDPNTPGQPAHVLRRFEFVHARASQSVAVLDTATNHVHVFLKGSFERIKNLSTADSIPADYDETAAEYAKEGCYVLALAHRDLGELGTDITMSNIKAMSRDDMEHGCGFHGFILFRNMLKHDTAEAIAELKEGDTRVVMITGDTALTGIFIARQSGMVASHQRVLLGDVVAGRMVWTDVDSGATADVDQVLQEDRHDDHDKQVELALTGRAFNFLLSQDQIRKYLLHTRVFARMTPNDKVSCVQLHMEKGVTAMCGDGGNDCGALRAAHVGLALSEAEASIVSPFSTNQRSIKQAVELLRQGRSALATSFANYKFLIFYGECMAFWELIMFYFTVIGTQPVWISIDGCTTTSMTLAITQALPALKLADSRPTAKPLGYQTVASCLGVIFINFWFIVTSVVWLFQQDWFICNQFDSSAVNSAQWWLIGDNYEAEILSLVIMAQFFHNGFLVNFGSVHRRSWYRNYLLVFIWCCFFIHVSYLTLADPNPYSCIYRINCGSADVLESLGYPAPWWGIEPYNSPLGHNVLPKSFRWKLWLFIVGNLIATTVWERVIVLGLGRSWALKRIKKNPDPKRIRFKL